MRKEICWLLHGDTSYQFSLEIFTIPQQANFGWVGASRGCLTRLNRQKYDTGQKWLNLKELRKPAENQHQRQKRVATKILCLDIGKIAINCCDVFILSTDWYAIDRASFGKKHGVIWNKELNWFWNYVLEIWKASMTIFLEEIMRAWKNPRVKKFPEGHPHLGSEMRKRRDIPLSMFTGTKERLYRRFPWYFQMRVAGRVIPSLARTPIY